MNAKDIKKQPKKVVTAFSLSPTIVDEIDKARGMIPRSTYVEHLLKIALDK